MKIIKLVLISAVALFALIWIISLAMPSKVKVSRAIDIHASYDSIHRYLSDIQNWEQWNRFVDSFSNKKYPSSATLTADQITIDITSTADSVIKSSWQQKNTDLFTAGYQLFAHGNVTTVHWYFDFKVKWYPWEKFASMVYEDQMGPVMERSLAALKEKMEQH